jgi:hypothetical protein
MSFASIALGEGTWIFRKKIDDVFCKEIVRGGEAYLDGQTAPRPALRCSAKSGRQLVSVASQCGLWAKGIIGALIMQPATQLHPGQGLVTHFTAWIDHGRSVLGHRDILSSAFLAGS